MSKYFVSVTPKGQVSVRRISEFDSEEVNLGELERDIMDSLATAGHVPDILNKFAKAAFNLGQRTPKPPKSS